MLSRTPLAHTGNRRPTGPYIGRYIGLLLLLLWVTACGATDESPNNAAVQIALLPTPQGETTTILRVQLRNAAQEPITDATVRLEGNMNHAGMVPVIADPVTDSADGSTDGIYQAPFTLTMLGDWIITVAVELADGSQVTEDIPVTVTDAGLQLPAGADKGENGATGGQMMVHDAMMRAVPIAGGNGALYFTLMNGAAQADQLLAVESDVAHAEIHESIEEDNMIRMAARPDGFAIPAGGMVELTPGGKHVMLVGVARPLQEGETITVTLRFAHAAPLSVTVPILALGSTMEGEHQHED